MGLAELFKELHYNVSIRLEMVSDSTRHILQRRGPRGLKHIEIRCLCQYSSGYERNVYLASRVDTKNNTADLFTKHLDGLRTLSLAKKLGVRILGWVQMLGTVTTESFSTALPVEQGCKYSQFITVDRLYTTLDIDLCTLITSFLHLLLFLLQLVHRQTQFN